MDTKKITCNLLLTEVDGVQNYRLLNRSNNIKFDCTPDPVCNQLLESGTKILLFFERHASAFCLRAMPKLDRLGVLFQELRVKVAGVLMWLADCFLLHHIHILVWIQFSIYAL